MRLLVPPRRLPIVGVLFLIASLLAPSVTFAHERRVVDKYALVVGFNGEPAIQGQPNGMQITVTEPGADNRPVEGLADTLRAAVAFGGGQPKEFKLHANRSRPGQYVADFIPTRSGTYIFTFSGTVEGTAINERFESGPGRFDDVEPIESLQFPDAVPLANDAARIARAAGDQAAAADAAADSARTMAMTGIGLGIFGLILGGISLAMLLARRASQVGDAERR
jgi:hypothetical protein